MSARAAHPRYLLRLIELELLDRERRVRTHNQKLTVAAMQIAARKFVAFRSSRVAMRRKSFRRQNMRSMGVTVPVEDGREAVFPDAIGLGRDVRHRASLFDLPRQGIAVMALVRV